MWINHSTFMLSLQKDKQGKAKILNEDQLDAIRLRG